MMQPHAVLHEALRLHPLGATLDADRGSALRRLSKDKSAVVRLRVAENRNVPGGVLRRLGSDDDRDVRRAAGENHHSPKKVK